MDRNDLIETITVNLNDLKEKIGNLGTNETICIVKNCGNPRNRTIPHGEFLRYCVDHTVRETEDIDNILCADCHCDNYRCQGRIFCKYC
jgi:hypothetical protein